MSRFYTETQEARMRADVQFIPTASTGGAHAAVLVRNGNRQIEEGDPEWYTDFDVIEFLGAEYPDFEIVGELVDLTESTDDEFLYVASLRRIS